MTTAETPEVAAPCLRHDFSLAAPGGRPPRLFRLWRQDLRARCLWYGQEPSFAAMLRTLAMDGSLATMLYRAMAWTQRRRLTPAAMVLGKLLTFCCGAVIGRGARFGPGLVLLHPIGVVINTSVVAGANCVIESCVTIGAEKGLSPRLGDHVFVGSGARLLGDLAIGDRARIGANAVVLHDVPADATAVGVPARVVARQEDTA